MSWCTAGLHNRFLIINWHPHQNQSDCAVVIILPVAPTNASICKHPQRKSSAKSMTNIGQHARGESLYINKFHPHSLSRRHSDAELDIVMSAASLSVCGYVSIRWASYVLWFTEPFTSPYCGGVLYYWYSFAFIYQKITLYFRKTSHARND